MDSSSPTPRPASPTDSTAIPIVQSTNSTDSTLIPASSPPLEDLSSTPVTVTSQAQLGRGLPPPEETDLASFATNPPIPSTSSTPVPLLHPIRTSILLPSSSRNPSQVETAYSTLSPATGHPTHSPHATEFSDAGSLLSAGEMSDSNYEYYAERERDKASRGISSATGGNKGGKGKRVNVGARTGSTVPSPAKTSGRERAMSPQLPLMGARSSVLMTAGVFDEDDEVLRRDRGEELVRKRMRDRARVKKVSFFYSFTSWSRVSC